MFEKMDPPQSDDVNKRSLQNASIPAWNNAYSTTILIVTDTYI